MTDNKNTIIVIGMDTGSGHDMSVSVLLERIKDELGDDIVIVPAETFLKQRRPEPLTLTDIRIKTHEPLIQPFIDKDTRPWYARFGKKRKHK